jgi:hypothetical protein
METSRPRRVSLTGELTGDYVIVEQRSDGSLVLEPDTSKRSSRRRRRPPSSIGGLLAGLGVRSNNSASSEVEVLEDWGIELGEGESAVEFFVADVNERSGFVVITSGRFIFVADTARGLAANQEHPLDSASDVELVRRGRRYRLRVTWDGADSVIDAPDRKTLARLREHLEGRAIA